MSFVVKIQHQEELRRLSFAPNITLNELKEEIRVKLSLGADTPFSIQYLDVDSDKVTIGSDEELDFARTSNTGSFLRLYIRSDAFLTSAAAASEESYDTLPEIEQCETVSSETAELASEMPALEDVHDISVEDESFPPQAESAAVTTVQSSQIGLQDIGVAASLMFNDVFNQVLPDLASRSIDIPAMQAQFAGTMEHVSAAASTLAHQIQIEVEKAQKLHAEQMEQFRKVREAQAAAAAAAAATAAPSASAEKPVVIHERVTCDGCSMYPLCGPRFKCGICPDYDLCEACESRCIHPPFHPMLKIKVPQDVQVHFQPEQRHHPVDPTPQEEEQQAETPVPVPEVVIPEPVVEPVSEPDAELSVEEKTLVDMGFELGAVREALGASYNNVDTALELLLR